jgi:hypothetical protein
MNLPESSAAVLKDAGVQVYWLKIGVRVEEEERLLELIASKMQGYDSPPFAGREPHRAY